MDFLLKDLSQELKWKHFSTIHNYKKRYALKRI